jgi:hypothetical protein
MGYDLNRINGPGAEGELAKARAMNRASSPLGRAALNELLKGIAGEVGVVDPEASLRVHSGEVQAVDVSTQPEAGSDDQAVE